jgi:hypothetical protein
MPPPPNIPNRHSLDVRCHGLSPRSNAATLGGRGSRQFGGICPERCRLGCWVVGLTRGCHHQQPTSHEHNCPSGRSQLHHALCLCVRHALRDKTPNKAALTTVIQVMDSAINMVILYQIWKPAYSAVMDPFPTTKPTSLLSSHSPNHQHPR